MEIIKCLGCNNEKEFILVVDKYENGIEIPRLRCLRCNTTYSIIIGDKV
jgi:hypothetical protein